MSGFVVRTRRRAPSKILHAVNVPTPMRILLLLAPSTDADDQV